MYRPLLECLTIKSSSIQGLGLFATQDIPKDTDLGISHIKFPDGIAIRMPLGGFYNHSDEPNCVKRFVDLGSTATYNIYKLDTLRDIKSGEEITVKYTFYEV